MAWQGAFFGALIGLLLVKSVWGAVIGAFIGYMLDPRSHGQSGSGAATSVAAEFFRTTFEIMGYVAKSDGRVSEAEIDAARRLMQQFNLSPADVNAAIGCARHADCGTICCEPSSSCNCARRWMAMACRRRRAQF
jgi:DnaJ like chaperone protein